MIIRIIQSLINGKSNEVVEQGAVEEAKKRNREVKFIDVAQEVLNQRAAEKGADLDGMVKYGWPHVKKEKFKGSVRKKVWNAVSRSIDSSDDEMVEEITERIADVAEVDPYYQKMFEEKAE